LVIVCVCVRLFLPFFLSLPLSSPLFPASVSVSVSLSASSYLTLLSPLSLSFSLSLSPLSLSPLSLSPRIIRGVDYEGRICGKDVGVENEILAAWPYPPAYQFKVCVSECSVTNTDSNKFNPTYPSTRLVYYCVPDPSSIPNAQVPDGFESASASASRAMGDLLTAWPIILISAFAALIISFLYMYLTEKCATVMVWGGIILIAFAGALFTYVLLNRADEYRSTQLNDRAKAMDYLGYAVGICTFLFVIIVICLRERINIAIEVVREAAKAIQDMRTLVLFPIGPFLVGLAYFVFFIATALHIFSVGEFKDVTTPTEITSISDFSGVPTYKDFEWNQELKNAFAFLFFHGLWNIQFLIYFGYLVVAGAIADWYFTPYRDGEKPRGSNPDELGHRPVLDAVARTLRFHLGTIAIASLIIAIIQFIRACVKYIEEKSKAQGEPNAIQKCAFCMLNCCLRCLECCMDKVNKNALIWTAIWGDGFAVSVCNSFALIWRNLARIAAVNMVGSYLVLLGKIMVALATTGLCGLFMISNSYFKEKLNSIVMPSVTIFLLSFLVASLFMLIYETAIDTIFLCFLVDEEHNKGGNMLASKDLIEIVDRYGEVSIRRANTEQEISMKRSQTLGRSQMDVRQE
jgi:Plasma-membrane choline transporter